MIKNIRQYLLNWSENQLNDCLQWDVPISFFINLLLFKSLVQKIEMDSILL